MVCLTSNSINSALQDSLRRRRTSCSVGRMGPRSTAPPPRNRDHAPHHRVAAFVWNPGGISRARLDEFLLWAERQIPGILILPETRWSFESSWENEKWLFIHSGPGAGRSAGLMVTISKQLCSSPMLSFRTIIPGRLIHLRLHLKPRYLDVVAVYQHPGHSSADLAARSILWDHHLQDDTGCFWEETSTAVLQLGIR